MATQKRQLQITILRLIARTGQLLSNVQRNMPDHYQTILRFQGLTSSEADDYIAVFQHAKVIKLAEQCSEELGTPTTAREALDVLQNLQNKRH